jgi:Xaa-Pro dipeptidase
MLNPETLPHLQALIAEQRLDGWLLFDFKGRNPIAAAVLGEWIVGTRRVFVFVPRSGVPVALVHEIDAELWHNWPESWSKHIGVRQQELEQALALYTGGLRIAADFSSRGASPYLDCVPAGMIDLLSEFACELTPSAELVTQGRLPSKRWRSCNYSGIKIENSLPRGISPASLTRLGISGGAFTPHFNYRRSQGK